MQEIDSVFKSTLALQPDCFLDLIFGKKREVKLKEVTDPQINVPELRADKALLVKENRKVFGLICEAMIQPDRSELPAYAFKAMGLQYVSKHPALVVIVYLEKGKYATFPSGFENKVGGLSTGVWFTKILLWEHESRILSGELKELAPFLPLFHKDPDPGLIEVQKRLLTQVTDPKLQADLLANAMVVDVRAFGMKVVLAKFKKELNMLKETSLVKGWLAESLQEGLRKGERKGERRGERKGERRGERQGKLAVIQRILAQKLGRLTPELRTKLQSLDSNQLDKLSLTLLDIESKQELLAWLNNGASKHAKH